MSSISKYGAAIWLILYKKLAAMRTQNERHMRPCRLPAGWIIAVKRAANLEF